jgi:hypothetical protein
MCSSTIYDVTYVNTDQNITYANSKALAVTAVNSVTFRTDVHVPLVEAHKLTRHNLNTITVSLTIVYYNSYLLISTCISG